MLKQRRKSLEEYIDISSGHPFVKNYTLKTKSKIGQFLDIIEKLFWKINISAGIIEQGNTFETGYILKTADFLRGVYFYDIKRNGSNSFKKIYTEGKTAEEALDIFAKLIDKKIKKGFFISKKNFVQGCPKETYFIYLNEKNDYTYRKFTYDHLE